MNYIRISSIRTIGLLLIATARPALAFPRSVMSPPSPSFSAFHTAFWNRIAATYDDTSPKTNAYRDRRLKLLLDERYLKPDDKVLDFACATGRLAMDLSVHVHSVLGIDLSQKMIQKAQEKVEGSPGCNVRFATTDLFDESLDGEGFSVVGAFNVLHLVPTPELFLRRIGGLMAPRGLLISETPCMGTKPWYFQTAIGVAAWTGLVPKAQALTQEGIEKMMTDEGFEVVKSIVLEGGDPLIVARKRDA